MFLQPSQQERGGERQENRVLWQLPIVKHTKMDDAADE